MMQKSFQLKEGVLSFSHDCVYLQPGYILFNICGLQKGTQVLLLCPLLRGMQDVQDLQVQRDHRETLETLVLQEPAAPVALRAPLEHQDPEVWTCFFTTA